MDADRDIHRIDAGDDSRETTHRSLSFGVERLGFLSLRWPILTLVLVIAVTGVALFGFTKLQVDDSLSELFRADTPEFAAYETMSRQFPSSEYDVLVVVEGANLLKRDTVAVFRDAVTELQFVPAIRGVISLFSAREPPAAGTVPAPLFPAELPDGEDYDKLVAKVLDNKIIAGKLLSDDGELALIVIALDPQVVASAGLGGEVNEIRKTLEPPLRDAGLSVQLSGVPVMQLEIRNAVEHDRLIYNGLGFLLGSLIAYLFFRRLTLMAIAATPPIVAILWSLGFFGLTGFKLNLFLNVMSPLIMVLGFSDSMQLTYAMRARLLAGQSTKEAMQRALVVVGPACVLTSVVAGASFIVLFVSDSALIRTFGAAGVISTTIALMATLFLVPLLTLLLLRGRPDFATGLKADDAGMDWLRRVCHWIAALVVRRPWIFVVGGMALVVAFGAVYLSLDPRYRLADQVPDRQEAVATSGRLDAKLTGANPVDVMITWPADRTLYDPEVLDVIGGVHSVLERQKGMGNVWSVETLRRWLIEGGEPGIDVLKTYVELLPEHLTGRFINFDRHAALVTGRIPDVDAAEILPMVKQLDTDLGGVRQRHPDVQIVTTGLSVVAARNSAQMIDTLNMGLTVEMALICIFMGLAFRSAFVAVVSVLPNLFPVFTAGAVLAATAEGLQFASIIALTVSFGLALNAAIHYFNRLRLEHVPGEDPAIGVTRATVLVGPALILTTMVLAIGLGVTVFSDLPSLRLFGRLSVITLMAALVGDLLILPATVLLVRRTIHRRRQARAPETRGV